MLRSRIRGEDSSAPVARGFPAHPRWAGTLLRAVAAVVAGLALYASFPPLGWWWAAPLGIALLLGTVADRSWKAAAGWGALGVVAYEYPLLSWTGTYVGAVWLFALLVVVLAATIPLAFVPLLARLPGRRCGSRACGWRGRH